MAKCNDPEGMKELGDPDFQKKQAQKEEELKEELKELLVKSFKHHDYKKTDVLDKDEAAIFFGHLVSEESGFSEAMEKLAEKRSFDEKCRELTYDKDNPDQFTQSCFTRLNAWKDMQEMIKAVEEETREMRTDYQKNKAERDAAGFKVIDSSGDGTIQLNEFVAALTPKDPKNADFIAALGYVRRQRSAKEDHEPKGM